MTKNTIAKSLTSFYILSCLINGQSQPDFLGYWTGQEDLESESLTYENVTVTFEETTTEADIIQIQINK